MKNILFLVLIVMCSIAMFPYTALAQEPARPIVRLIYFRASDTALRPNVDAEIDARIKKAQLFFADEMERHGFGRKTFQFETDASGNAVVHHTVGKFTYAHYLNNGFNMGKEDIVQFIPTQRSINVFMIGTHGATEVPACGWGGGNGVSGSASIFCWYWEILAHELGHAFGMFWHDHRGPGYIMSYGDWTDGLSKCSAELLNIIPAFNIDQTVSKNQSGTIKMLPPSLAAPPNAIRLRFEVTDPDGLHQALLLTNETTLTGYGGGLLGCKLLDSQSSTIEFITTGLTLKNTVVVLQIIDVFGSFITRQAFPIDISSLLPPSQVVSIPDPHLAAAVRQVLNLSSSQTLTTHSMLNLRRLNVSNSGITDLTGLEHAHNLRRLNIGSEYIEGEGLVNSNTVSDLSALSELTNLTSLYLSSNNISDISALSELTNLARLYLDNNNISDISALSELTQLDWLYLFNNNISDISALLELTNLVSLYLDNNNISDISALSELTNLVLLYLDDNNISDISVLSELTNLARLYLNNNNISDISALSELTNLARLYLNNNNISDISALSELTNLVSLYLGGNNISDISPIAEITQLTALSLEGNNISDISPLKGLTQLIHLYLYTNNISDISLLAGMTQLTNLNLDSNNISDISPLKGLTQLTSLWLRRNKISDISPLAGMTQLTQLAMGSNSISDVSPLADLTQLIWLDLSENAISDISPLIELNLTGTGIPWSNFGLLLRGNPLSHDSIRKHIPAMQERGIVVSFDNITHPALHLISGDKQEELVGRTLPSPFVVEYRDANGKPKEGVKVTFSIADGDAELTDTTATTDADGRAQIFLRFGWKLGTITVNVTAEGINSQLTFTAKAVLPENHAPEDVNADGIVDVEDLVLVAATIGTTPPEDTYLNPDVNADGVVNSDDLALVMAALENTPTAPAAVMTAENLKRWIDEAKQLTNKDATFLRGIGVLEELLASLLPEKTALLANYPNPFNPETWIPYHLARPAEVTLHIYGVDGALVRTLALGHRQAGIYEHQSRAAYWDGRNAQGERVASGIYFYTLSAGDFTSTRKMLIRK